MGQTRREEIAYRLSLGVPWQILSCMGKVGPKLAAGTVRVSFNSDRLIASPYFFERTFVVGLRYTSSVRLVGMGFIRYVLEVVV